MFNLSMWDKSSQHPPSYANPHQIHMWEYSIKVGMPFFSNLSFLIFDRTIGSDTNVFKVVELSLLSCFFDMVSGVSEKRGHGFEFQRPLI